MRRPTETSGDWEQYAKYLEGEVRRLGRLAIGLRRSISRYVCGADMHSPRYIRVLHWLDRHPELRDGPWSFYHLSSSQIRRRWYQS